MTVTSFGFLVLLGVGVIMYYIAPKKMQWIVLLCLSIVFYTLAANPYTLIYLMITSLLSYVAGMIVCQRNSKPFKEKFVSIIIALAILSNILIWFIVKGKSFWLWGFKLLHRFFPSIGLPQTELIAALGMGYYTAQAIGYILDVYWGITEAEKNPLKVFLFVAFFPQLTVGPISKFSQLQSLFTPHTFLYKNLCFGSQRILWGLLKKIVISDRLATVVGSIWSDPVIYTGIWPWIAVFLYPLEIYTDFSGCMDIVLGAAELFDIKMPENFNNPFYALTVQEFWQRWHITLGLWAKDYVYYPILKSKPMIQIGKYFKKHFSKKVAKFIPWSIGMGVLWFVMGFWHGSLRHIVGVSAWYWCILTISELCQPMFKKINVILKVDVETYSWKLFQRLRTYFVFSMGCIFFVSESSYDAYARCMFLFSNLKVSNVWTIFDGTILNTGISWVDINVLILCFIIMIIVAILREKNGFARIWMSYQILPFRWMVWISLFVIVLIYGHYGPGYDASQFIYQGF